MSERPTTDKFKETPNLITVKCPTCGRINIIPRTEWNNNKDKKFRCAWGCATVFKVILK